jgi:hypothetical protein
MLKHEGLEFQMCKNPDVKCSIIERAQRTIRERLNKYFTYKNSYRFIDVLPKFIRGYNDTVHSTMGTVPCEVNDSDILTIWNRLTRKRLHIRSATQRSAWANTLE